MLAIPDTTTQRFVCLTRWTSIGGEVLTAVAPWNRLNLALAWLQSSSLILLFLGFMSLSECATFFSSNCWWFQFLDLKCCWLILTQRSLFFCFYILISREVIAYMHCHLQSDDYSTTLIFLLLKLGYGHTISLHFYENHKFSKQKLQKIYYKFKYTINKIYQHLLTYASMMTVKFWTAGKQHLSSIKEVFCETLCFLASISHLVHM